MISCGSGAQGSVKIKNFSYTLSGHLYQGIMDVGGIVVIFLCGDPHSDFDC